MTDLAHELTVGYSTLVGRATQVSPPPRDGVEVIVCVQGTTTGGPLPLMPCADRVVHVPGVGVARSRNAAIDAAARRYLLFADDDVTICLDGVLAAAAYLRRTGKAIALGRGLGPDGRPRKSYPTDRPVPLTRFNSAKAATYEILVDVEQVRRAGVRFDERFGAGVQTYLGDEYIFIAQALRAGLRGTALPLPFGIHPQTSSGSCWGGRDLHVRAVVLNHVFGTAAPLARLMFGLRRHRQIGGVRALCTFVADGARLSPLQGAASARGVAEPVPMVSASAPRFRAAQPADS